MISRQRYFGIPFPVWYPLDADGEPDYDHPLLPREEDLPLDPSTVAPTRVRGQGVRDASTQIFAANGRTTRSVANPEMPGAD